MKIPNQIKIGGHLIPIVLHDSREIDNPGEFNIYHQRIRLRKDPEIRQDIVDEAFLHEIFEAIKNLNNLTIDHTHLTVFSEMLFQVIRDNDLDFREGSENHETKS